MEVMDIRENELWIYLRMGDVSAKKKTYTVNHCKRQLNRGMGKHNCDMKHKREGKHHKTGWEQITV